MKIQLLAITLLFFGGLSSQKIKKSFIIRVAPDCGWMLKFENNSDFKYYYSNLLGGYKMLAKGNYELDNGLLILQFIETDSSYQNEIPKELFYTKLSEKEFESLNESIFASKEESFLFRKNYIVLSKKKLEMD